MPGNTISGKEIRERYNKALTDRQLWSDEIDQAYRWMMPNRLPLSDTSSSQFVTSSAQTKGEPRTNHIFDPTGMESVLSFANNVQTSLMPPYTKWAKIAVGDLVEKVPKSFVDLFGPITQTTIDEMKKQLENVNNILFEEITRSKLETVINESFQDLSLIMGVLLLRPGKFKDPLTYIAVPANQVVVEEGAFGAIENVFVPHSVKARTLLEKWPAAEPNLTTSLRQQISDAPESPINLIEGVITFPNLPEGQKHYYFLITQDGNNELITEFIKVNPFIVFRGSKSPGEVYGRGPGLVALPYVRSLNKTTEYLLRGLQIQAYPIFVMSGNSDINPYTFSLEPGSIFRSAPGERVQDALSSLTGAPPQVPLEWVNQTQMQIKEIMFANPLNVNSSGDKTATEANIINNQWIQKNAGFFSRLSYELLPPLINKTILMLIEKGIMPKVEINGIPVMPISENPLFKLEFNSPLAQIQNQKDIQAITEAVQFSTQALQGPEGLLSLEIGKLFEEVYEKLGVPPELINYDFKKSPLIKKLQNSIQGNQPPPTQPALTGNVGQGTPSPGAPVTQTSQ